MVFGQTTALRLPFPAAVRASLVVLTLLLIVAPLQGLASVEALPDNEHLYEGETLVTAAGFPALVKYVEADKDKPLVIFVPGDAHLARIAYGFPEGNERDFLAYWLNQAGFPFLGVSYPLDNPVFSKTYPEYGIRDWGEQVAEIAAHFIRENGLSNHVIICGWSMGGKIAASVSDAARRNGLVPDVFVAMSADPPVTGLLPKSLTDNIKMLPGGLADREGVFPWFVNAIEQQGDYNGRTIIPKGVFLQQFIGNIPVGLMETGLLYRDGKFVHDLQETLDRAETLNFSGIPDPGRTPRRFARRRRKRAVRHVRLGLHPQPGHRQPDACGYALRQAVTGTMAGDPTGRQNVCRLPDRSGARQSFLFPGRDRRPAGSAENNRTASARLDHEVNSATSDSDAKTTGSVAAEPAY